MPDLSNSVNFPLTQRASVEEAVPNVAKSHIHVLTAITMWTHAALTTTECGFRDLISIRPECFSPDTLDNTVIGSLRTDVTAR